MEEVKTISLFENKKFSDLDDTGIKFNKLG